MQYPLLQSEDSHVMPAHERKAAFAHAVAAVHSSEVAASFACWAAGRAKDVPTDLDVAKHDAASDSTKISYGELSETSLSSDLPYSSRPSLRGPGLPLAERLQWYLPPRRPYSRRELLADRFVNFAGALFSWPCAAWLGYITWRSNLSNAQRICFLLFGLGLVSMLNLSALYHHASWDWEKAQRVYSSLDQVGINFMIIGCYAPLMLAVEGYKTLTVVCALGAVGLVLQGLRVARVNLRPLSQKKGARWTILDLINVVHYVLMGVMVIPPFPDIIANVQPDALGIMLAGGILYIIGVPFLLFERLEFHQAYWHALVLMASSCFYAANVRQILHGADAQMQE
jgi:hemolysin III